MVNSPDQNANPILPSPELPPSIVLRLSIVISLIFLLFFSLEDFPEEDTDCQFAANFLDHKSVNMNEILCLDVGGDKYRDVDDEETIYSICNMNLELNIPTSKT